MDTKVTCILSYCTWVGLLIAYLAGDKESALARHHLNNGLVLFLFGLASVIPIVGQLWAIFIIVCLVMGIIAACKGEEKELPLLGKIKIIK